MSDKALAVNWKQFKERVDRVIKENDYKDEEVEILYIDTHMPYDEEDLDIGIDKTHDRIEMTIT